MITSFSQLATKLYETPGYLSMERKIADVKKKIFKFTTYGVALDIINHPEVTHKKHSWQIWFRKDRGLGQPLFMGARRRGKGPWIQPEAQMFPQELKDYLELTKKHRNWYQLDWTSWPNFVQQMRREHMCFRTPGNEIKFNVIIEEKVDYNPHKIYGVALGCILEGYQETTPWYELFFPFGEDDYWSTLQLVEDTAQRMLAEMEEEEEDGDIQGVGHS